MNPDILNGPTAAGSHGTRLMRQEGGELRLIVAQEDGKEAWYVIRLAGEQYGEYKKAMREDEVSLTRYGSIVASGWGHVTAELKERLFKEFGVIS